MSTPSMSCERVLRTECSFNDDNTTYISHWPRQKSPKDCQEKCKITSYPACHFWMHHSSNEICDLYERDKRTCYSIGVPASLTTLYCTGMQTKKHYHSLHLDILLLFGYQIEMEIYFLEDLQFS